MNSPLITIAIPIYNAKEYLSYAIRSCMNQTYKHWELLLMEDGSTDGSDIIAKDFSLKDDRIKYISDGKNRGLVYRLNESINLAKGKYYARMDADDIMVVTRIEEQVSFLESHHEIDVLGASIMTIDNRNRIVGSNYSYGHVYSFIHPTVIGKLDWFKRNHYEEWAVRAEDFELWIRTKDKSVFYSLGKPLLFYREFGVPSFHKTYMSLKTLLSIFNRYRQYNKPFSWFVKNSFLTYLKILIYAFFYFIRKEDYLISKRKRVKLPTDLCLSESDILCSIS